MDNIPDINQALSKNPKHTPTMVSHLPLRRHGFSESAHPTPGSLFGRGPPRSQWKDLDNTNHRAEKKIVRKLDNFILVFNTLPIYSHQNDWFAPPPRSLMVAPPLHTFLCHSSSFWLVVVWKIIHRQPSKAKVYYIFTFFCHSNCRPNRCANVPPHAPPRRCLLSNISTTAVANSYLIDVFPN